MSRRRLETTGDLNGDGNGTFTNRFDNTVGSLIHRQPVSIAIGDLNHDGLLDIILANPGSNEVSVLLRNVIV